jgi:hypothetical protein
MFDPIERGETIRLVPPGGLEALFQSREDIKEVLEPERAGK